MRMLITQCIMDLKDLVVLNYILVATSVLTFMEEQHLEGDLDFKDRRNPANQNGTERKLLRLVNTESQKEDNSEVVFSCRPFPNILKYWDHQ